MSKGIVLVCQLGFGFTDMNYLQWERTVNKQKKWSMNGRMTFRFPLFWGRKENQSHPNELKTKNEWLKHLLTVLTLPFLLF